jgi:hypothetical protein
MKNNNTENNIMNHKDALEKADEQAELGKKYITDIAMTCSNDYTVIDSLMCILELFTVKDADVSVRDLAGELQDYLFRWTKEYGNSVDAWKDSVLCGTKYKDAPAKKESSEKLPDNYDIDLLAIELSEVLNNPNLPAKLYNIITDELCENHSDTTSPDNIKANLLNNSGLQDT